MKGIDTNVLLRIFVNDNDPQWKAAHRILGQSQESLYINIITLCEVIWALRKVYTYSNSQLVMVIEKLVAIEEFTLEDEDIVYEALAIYKEDPTELADILIGLRNKEAGCKTTLTFDKSAAKLDEFTLLA